MQLTSFSVGGFQSYREPQSVTIDPYLTLIAGRNNIGKSALLRAMRVFVEDQEGARENFEVSYAWSLTSDELLELTLIPGETSREYEEWARQRDRHDLRATYRRNPPGEGAVGERNLYLYRLELPAEEKRATGGPGGQPQWDSGEWGGTAYVDLLARAPEKLVRRMKFVSPRRIDTGPRGLNPVPFLDAEAGNLTEVVLDLVMNSQTRKFRELTEFMVSAFPEIQAITVMRAEPTLGRLALNYEDSEAPIPLEQSGTGIAQMLALATAVLTAKEPGLFLIDEPQAYLHPDAERSLLRLIADNSEHQYIIATHSNYLLSARPLASARLLAMQDGATHITEFPSQTDLLSELGITAADLWSTERILWVEGPSEVEAVAVAIGDAAKDVRVQAMPDAASRFSSTSPKQAEATYRFLEDVATALAPLPVRMVFLFDSDEKTAEHRGRIEEASRGSAVFLPVRELENLFLDADLLTLALTERAELLGIEAPSASDIQKRLDAMLKDQDERSLFSRPPRAGTDARESVRGSEVLRRLYWDTTVSTYEKVSDGKRLAELANERKPELLEPLRQVIATLIKNETEPVET